MAPGDSTRQRISTTILEASFARATILRDRIAAGEPSSAVKARLTDELMSTFRVASLLFIMMLLNAGPARAQDLDAGKSGQRLFATNCATCHRTPRGLAKLPADRFPTAREFAQALSGAPVGGYTSQTDARAEEPVRITLALPRERLRSLGRWFVAAAVVIAGIAGWIRARPRADAAAQHITFALEVSDSTRPREEIGGQNITMSPDGTTLATGGKDGMMRQWAADGGKAGLVTFVTLGTVRSITYSPDGKHLIVGATAA